MRILRTRGGWTWTSEGASRHEPRDLSNRAQELGEIGLSLCGDENHAVDTYGREPHHGRRDTAGVAPHRAVVVNATVAELGTHPTLGAVTECGSDVRDNRRGRSGGCVCTAIVHCANLITELRRCVTADEDRTVGNLPGECEGLGAFPRGVNRRRRLRWII